MQTPQALELAFSHTCTHMSVHMHGMHADAQELHMHACRYSYLDVLQFTIIDSQNEENGAAMPMSSYVFIDSFRIPIDGSFPIQAMGIFSSSIQMVTSPNSTMNQFKEQMGADQWLFNILQEQGQVFGERGPSAGVYV